MGTLALFPAHLLVPQASHYWARQGPCGLAAIHVPLAPFRLDGATVQTALRLDGIALDLGDLRALAGQSHRFPANPDEGYIDGSMYLNNQHVPVDITELAFGDLQPDGLLPLHLAGTMAFAAAGMPDWRDTPLALGTVLEPEPTPEQIEAAIAAAVEASGARTVRDAGKAMGQLTRQHPHWENRQALHQAVCRHLEQQTTHTNAP